MSYKIYNYSKQVDVDGDVKPENLHLAIETDSGDYIYFADSANNKLLKKLDVSDGSVSTIETRTFNITRCWYDRTNGIIYFIDNDDTDWSYIWKLDLSDDSVTEIDFVATNIFDIWIYSNKLYLLFYTKATVNRAVYVMNYTDTLNWNVDMGAKAGRSSIISQIVIVGSDFYFLWKWSNENVELWKWDSVGHGFTEMEDCGATTELPIVLQGAIPYDDSDILYFTLGTGTAEVSTIVAQVAANIDDGDYITYSAIELDYENVRSEKDYYIWFDKVGDESGDPAPADKTKITVDISAAVTAQDVSDAIESAVNAVVLITCDNAGGVTCTLTNHYNGNTTNIADVDSGLAVATTTPGVDNTYYLYTYSISGDALTQKGEYNIALMLDRNTDSTNDIPFNLEKAFDIALDVDNRAKVYQISKGRGNIYAISRLSMTASDLIIAITDTYLIVDNDGTIELWKYVDFITYFTSKSYIHARTRNYWKASLWLLETGPLGPFEVFDGMFIRIIGYMTYAGNGWYHNEPDNFNDETAGAITVAGDMAWLNTLTLPDTCTAILGIVDGHKNVLGIAHAGVGDPIVIHQMASQEATGIYEWFWGSSDVVRNQTIRFRGTGIAIYLRINTSKYTYLDSLDAEIEIIGATPTNNILDHFKLVWDCATDTFDLYINEVIRVTAGEFNNPDTYIDELYMASITGAVYTQYINAPGDVADANYYEGMNLLETDRNAVVMEGYVVWDDDEHKRKISLDSPAMFDLKNKTEVGEYSGRTDQHIASNLVDFANYIIAGTMSAGAALGTLTQRGRKSLKVRINGHAQHDQFIFVIQCDNGQGLLHYNAGTVDSYFNLTETNKLGRFKKKKLRKIINQVNLKGALPTGTPIKWTENDLASQQIYGVQPIFRTFANLDTKALLEVQAQSILTMDQSTPYKYTFTKKIGSEGLVLPSETVNLTYTSKSVIADDRIIDNIKFYFRKKKCKWTVIDAITYTSDMDILMQEIQENTDLIEQLGELISKITGGLALYLQQDASADIGGYLLMCVDFPLDAKTAAIDGVAVTADAQLLKAWATPVDCPGVTQLLTGIYGLHVHAYKPSGTKDIRLYFEVYKRVLAGTETLITTSEESIILPTVDGEINMHAYSAELPLLATDRIVMKLYANLEGTGVNPTVTVYVEGIGADVTMSLIQLPVSAIQGADIVGFGNCSIAMGTYTGDGSGDVNGWDNFNPITGIGFTPKYVRIWDFTAESYIFIWMDEFPANYVYAIWEIAVDSKHVGGEFWRLRGTADGFDVNDYEADGSPNTNGVTYYYMCLG